MCLGKKKLIVLSILISVVVCLFSQNLAKDSWKVIQVDTEEENESASGSGHAACVIDGDINTFWTTSYKTNWTPFPHSFVVDLGGLVDIREMYLYPRQDKVEGLIDNYQIYAGQDTMHWSLIHQGTFKKKDPMDRSPINVKFINKVLAARYLKFKILNPLFEDSEYIFLAEINIKGAYLGTFFFPHIRTAKNTIYKNEFAQFMDSSFVQNTEIRSRVWHFPGGIPSYSSDKNPKVHYKVYGTYGATLTITSKEGIKKTIYKPNAIHYFPATEIPRNRWITWVSEEETHKDNNSVKRLFDNSLNTHWHTLWFYGKKLPHFILVDLGKQTNIEAIGYLPRQRGSINGIFQSYRVFISNDTTDMGEEVCHVTEQKPYRNLRFIEFPPKNGRYLKIIIDKTFPIGANFASAAELYIYGEPSNNLSLLLSIIGSIVLLFGSIFIYWRKKQRKSKKKLSEEGLEPTNSTKIRMYFFGKFELYYDNAEVEELYKKIKQILALVTFHTIEYSGISTNELSRLLWADLPEENVVSARSSNMRRLRIILEKIPYLEVIVEKKIWKLQSSTELVFIDLKAYRELHSVVSESITKKELDKIQIDMLLSIIERGQFLEDFTVDWANEIRNIIAIQIIDILKSILNEYSDKLSKDMKNRICDCLFLQDKLNVDAFRTKLKLYVEDSNPGLAKELYDSYTQKYKSIYKENFPETLTEIIHRKTTLS